MNKFIQLFIILFSASYLAQAQCPSICPIGRPDLTFVGNGAGISNTSGISNTFMGRNAGFNNTAGFHNTFYGEASGLSNTTGANNSFFGKSAGISNTTGGGNAFFGVNSGAENTTASFNSFFGQLSGQDNTTGEKNSFFGHQAGNNNSTGSLNAFFGQDAGLLNTNGNQNAFFGQASGRNNTSGIRNAFFGQEAGLSNTNGSENAIFGENAGLNNTTGDKNSFFGQGAGNRNISGSQNAFFGENAGLRNLASLNSFFGQEAGSENSSGEKNAFFGQRAGFTNTTGNLNAFFGQGAGQRNSVGNQNAFFGQEAGFSNSSGSENAFFGQGAGRSNVSGSFNAFFGKDAGFRTSRGAENSFFGTFAGFSNVIGQANSFFGRSAGFDNQNGRANSFFGASAGANSVNGNFNTYMGESAGFNNVEGSGNVFLGYQAGFNELGANKLYIANSNTSSPLIYGDFNEQVVNVNGSLGVGIQNPERPIHLRAKNAIFRIDRDRDDPGFAVVRYDQGFDNVWKSFYFYTRGFGPNNGKFIIADWEQNVAGPSLARFVIANNGNVGIGDFLFANPSQKLTVAGNAQANGFFTSSDKRLKSDIQEVENALESLDNIHGFTYKFKENADFKKRNLPSGNKLGFIAQEIQQVYPELVAEDEEGYLSVNYDGMIPVLVEALKEEKQKRQALASRLEKLEARLAAQGLNQQEVAGVEVPALYQNQPNPFDQKTQISFFLPEDIQSAKLFVYDLQGKQIKWVEIEARGEASISFQSGTLPAGMYLYALVADGQEVAMKRMMITE